jgi:hypothetical protein
MRRPLRGSAFLPPVVAALALCLCPAIGAGTYLDAERIPTNSVVYRDLERLAATYGRSPQFMAMRPLRLVEARAFLESLAVVEPEARADPAFARAARSVDSAWPDATAPLVDRTGDDGERVTVSPYTTVRYEDDPRNRPDINRDYRAGVQVAASLDTSTFVFADVYEGTASQGGRGTPNFGTGNSLIEGVDLNSWVEEAYAEFLLGKVRVLAGRTWLRWGPGREGTLALSDAAPALDMARAELGLFRKLRVQWFVSLLDPGPETYLAGHRVEWSPAPRLSAGFTEMARFDGTSQAPLYLMPLVPYSFWEKRPKSRALLAGDTTGLALTKNNVLWSADVSWVARRGLRFWGELMVDDISFSRDYKPDMVGYQAGIEARRAIGGGDPDAEPDGGGGRAVSGALEYTRVNNFTYSAWHGHHFESESFPIGFVLGPDVASLVGEAAYEHGRAWEFRFRAEWRKKGEGRLGEPWEKQGGGQVDAAEFQGVVERETRVSGTIIYAPRRWLRLEAMIGAAAIKNRGHVRADPDDQNPIRLSGSLEW